jgi:hypothetical protein
VKVSRDGAVWQDERMLGSVCCLYPARAAAVGALVKAAKEKKP